MTITFEQDKDIVYAISLNQILDEYVYEELMWAEITLPKTPQGGYGVFWEDNYHYTHWFDSLENAKAHVLANWSIHKPHVNGDKAKVE